MIEDLERLKKFLTSKRCLVQFRKEYTKYMRSIGKEDTSYSFIRDTASDELIVAAFVWGNTTDGPEFWSKINKSWQKLLNKKS